MTHYFHVIEDAQVVLNFSKVEKIVSKIDSYCIIYAEWSPDARNSVARLISMFESISWQTNKLSKWQFFRAVIKIKIRI